ncbi:hypothetical protein [Taibaiella sp. KBW10]|uniref:DUF922 domain-containing protein n=1 Tax=Taibaiella sp. KBW10 TaxID=2153357 RepID=UPI000F5ADF83|nr:hypothetical protein [Taibaiella sp. KBW10]
MKFYVITIVLFLMTKMASAQLRFQDIPISWKDFSPTQKVLTRENGTAAINVNTAYQWESSTQNGIATINFTSSVTSDRSKNFVLATFMKTADTEQKDKLLRHEQGHYIIALIKNLWLQEALLSAHFTGRFKVEIREVCKGVEARAAQLSATYDAETNHSLIRPKQVEWEEKLLDLLNTLNYNKKTIPIHFDQKIVVKL